MATPSPSSFETQSSSCITSSTPAEQIPSRDKPSPLRIIKQCRGYSRKSGRDQKSLVSAVAGSETGSTAFGRHGDYEPLILAKKRSKIVSEEGYVDGHVAPGEEYPRKRSSRWYENKPQRNLLLRYPTLKVKKIRRRPHLKENIHGNNDNRNISSSTLPLEHKFGLGYPSRVSSRATDYELSDAPCLKSPMSTPRSSLLGSNGFQRSKNYVLSPHITIVPETDCLYDGQQCIWAAIEVCGGLFPVTTADSTLKIDQTPALANEADCFFEFGCLYDLTVQVHPTSKTSVKKVLHEQSFPTTIYAGSRILLVAQIQFETKPLGSPMRYGHSRQNSDELMEDLEFQLGDSPMTYMEIQVSYSHSAFPDYLNTHTQVGASALRTKIETVAKATIKRQNALSLWSPRPAPAPDQLFALITYHWGYNKAMEVMQQTLAKQATPRKPAMRTSEIPLKENHPIPSSTDNGDNHVTPLRDRGLKGGIFSTPAAVAKGGLGQTQRISAGPMLALQSSQGNGVSFDAEARSRKASTRKTSRSGPYSGTHDKQSSLRKRWSVGPELLRNMAPIEEISGFGAGSSEVETQSYAKVKKDSGLWSWGAWF